MQVVNHYLAVFTDIYHIERVELVFVVDIYTGSPVFEYEYNGQVYTFNGYYDRSNYYNVGQTKTLKINPDDPTDAHLSQRSNWYAYPIFIAGLGMLAFGIHTIKKIKADKESAMY